MDFDISQIWEFLGKTCTLLINILSFVWTVITKHPDLITLVISTLVLILTWLLYLHRTKRKLVIDVGLSPDISKLLKEGKKVRFVTWNVHIMNLEYHTVHVEEVGLLYKDYWFGKNKKLPIFTESMEVKPGDRKLTPTIIENTSHPREISGAYAKDKTGKEWRTYKRLKPRKEHRNR